MPGSTSGFRVGVSGSIRRVLVRRATPADAPGLATLDSLVNPSPWTPDQFASACRVRAGGAERALVVDGEGEAAGFVVYSRVLDEACIHSIAVQPSRQGRGLGRTLLTEALDHAATDGATRCYLEVRASNHTACRLYEKLGFQRDGLRKNYYSTVSGREDALLMSRQLGQE